MSENEVVAPASSLSPEMLAERQALETLMGDPQSVYHKGGDGISPAAAQRDFRALVRGEIAGVAGPINAEFDPSLDPPPGHAGAYDLNGLQIFVGGTRSTVDSFARACCAAGLGNQHFRSAVSWALLQTAPTPEGFRRWALENDWSDHAVYAALRWHYDEYARRSNPPRPADVATSVDVPPWIDLGNGRLEANPAYRW
jgi:hypothetical protein